MLYDDDDDDTDADGNNNNDSPFFSSFQLLLRISWSIVQTLLSALINQFNLSVSFLFVCIGFCLYN